MKGEKIFYLSWKGSESGAYSAEDIRDMLETGKIGYLHLIRTRTSEWVTLKNADLDDLEQKNNAPRADKTRENDFATILLYTTAGLTFLSPWVFGVSVALAVWRWVVGDKQNALVSLILSAFITACGLLFFGFIYPTVSE